MVDAYGRTIAYLRFSLTERCNLRCLYCRDAGETCKAIGELTADQICRIVAQAAALDIHKVRLTGGEPLLRPDLEEIVSCIAGMGQIDDLCMTTNAIGLADRAQALKQAGLHRLNISLDSLQPERYERLTRGGNISEVWNGIERALAVGLTPLKLNCVVVRGENDAEIADFIELARRYPIEVRFIELMPMGADRSLRAVSNQTILGAYPALRPLPPRDMSQPAQDYTADGFAGRVGFISPMSQRFCQFCNRIRVTADGRLLPCLGGGREVSLREALEQDDLALREVIRQGILQKPQESAFGEQHGPCRRMSRIGG